MSALRDEVCSVGVGILDTLGAFQDEIVIYGCVTIHMGKRQYHVTTDLESLLEFVEACQQQKKIVSPIEKKIVKAEHNRKQEVWLHQQKRLFAVDLRDMYPEDFFLCLETLEDHSGTCAAIPMIMQLQDIFTGRFRQEYMQLFLRVLQMAAQADQIDGQQYYQLLQWAKDIQQQMKDDVVAKDKYEVHLYGFLYWKEGEAYSITVNTQKEKVIAQAATLKLKHFIVGPIMDKRFWSVRHRMLPEVQLEFEQWLRTLMTEEIVKLIEHIKLLPPVLLKREVDKTLVQAESWSEKSQNALRQYLYDKNVYC